MLLPWRWRGWSQPHGAGRPCSGVIPLRSGALHSCLKSCSPDILTARGGTAALLARSESGRLQLAYTAIRPNDCGCIIYRSVPERLRSVLPTVVEEGRCHISATTWLLARPRSCRSGPILSAATPSVHPLAGRRSGRGEESLVASQGLGRSGCRSHCSDAGTSRLLPRKQRAATWRHLVARKVRSTACLPLPLTVALLRLPAVQQEKRGTGYPPRNYDPYSMPICHPTCNSLLDCAAWRHRCVRRP